MPTVQRIWTAPEGSAPMEARDSVRAIADAGLQGDRYCHDRGYYSPFDVCQATFVDSDAIEYVREEYGIDLSDGRHRRNIVVDCDVVKLLDTQFSVGEAVFEGTRRRPPCAHVEELAGEEGVARALSDERGGVCADVVEGGAVAVGDELRVVEQLDDPDSLADAIRERRSE
jgi:MOSC domain-containing protein YiiM